MRSHATAREGALGSPYPCRSEQTVATVFVSRTPFLTAAKLEKILKHNKKELALSLIRFLEERSIAYCIVGDIGRFPQLIDSDIDICISQGLLREVSNIIWEFCRKHGVELVQIIQHEQTAWYFILAWFDEHGDVNFLHPDICGDYYRNGKCFLRSEQVLAGRVHIRGQTGGSEGFFIPRPDIGFIYYLVKEIDKGELSEEQAKYLSNESKKDPVGCASQIHRFWSERKSKLLVEAIETGSWTLIRSLASRFKKDLRTGIPFSTIALLRELKRKACRILHPTGLLVVILGPDGSGKSSVSKRVMSDLAPAFRRTCYMHLRPRVGLRVDDNVTPVTKPHNQKPRGWFVSIVKIAYLLFDYNVGYWWKVRWLLVRSTLVVFDRYYYDLIVDPIRYRYAGPAWLVRWLGKIISKPDVCILLHSPAELLQARKQEVSFAETERQREAYLKLVKGMKNGVVIDGSQSLPKVVVDVERVVLDFMAARTTRRLGY